MYLKALDKKEDSGGGKTPTPRQRQKIAPLCNLKRRIQSFHICSRGFGDKANSAIGNNSGSRSTGADNEKQLPKRVALSHDGIHCCFDVCRV